jgi:hypothetical protein
MSQSMRRFRYAEQMGSDRRCSCRQVFFNLTFLVHTDISQNSHFNGGSTKTTDRCELGVRGLAADSGTTPTEQTTSKQTMEVSMAMRNGLAFTVKVDPSVKVAEKAKGAVAAAIGGAAAAEIARIDFGGTVAFIPRIDWPGGLVIDLQKFVPREKLDELMRGQP